MKTTRTILFSAATVLVLSTTAYVFTNVSLPVASFLEYGVGSLVALGLVAMSAATASPAHKDYPAAKGPAVPLHRSVARSHRHRIARRSFAHAA